MPGSAGYTELCWPSDKQKPIETIVDFAIILQCI